jgi:UDP-N-acetylmuramate dehydrogenase
MQLDLDIRENVSLAPFTTLKIGGPAKYFIKTTNDEELTKAFAIASSKRADILILGGGSNLLISDAGFDGYVIHIASKGIRFDDLGNYSHVTGEAGENWDKFVEDCVSRGLVGIECLSGIPGNVGGTPVQNVGAYGQEVSQTILAVRCFDRSNKKIVELDNASCGFSYRRSIFNSTERDRYIVLSVTFALKLGVSPKIVYADLKEFFGDTEPSAAEIRKAVIEIRRKKSMVIDESDPNSRSAGSFFKNPELSAEDFSAFEERAKTLGLGDVPSFPSGEKRKLPAAWLIEHAGFQKGYKLGKAGISTKHSLALINLGDAEAADIIRLKDSIQSAVREKFAIELVPEPVFAGFDHGI